MKTKFTILIKTITLKERKEEGHLKKVIIINKNLYLFKILLKTKTNLNT